MHRVMHSVRGVLLDISGVLYNGSPTGDGFAIQGSVDAFNRLLSSGLPVRLCSNETQNTRSDLVAKLRRLGYHQLAIDQIFTPAPAAVQLLQKKKLRPHLLIHPKLQPEFESLDTSDANCVVIGDAAESFTYANVNSAFQKIMSMKNPQLFTLGFGKYYLETDGLKMDVGAYAKALEYACDVKAELVGKPASSYFNIVLEDMGITAKDAVMVGDDIVGDIGGALSCGMQAIQVRTGKWRPEWENHPSIKPTAIANDLAEAVELILKSNGPVK